MGNEDEDKDAEYQLEGQRKPPGDGSIGEAESQVDPVTNHDTTGDQRTFEHDEFPTFVRVRGFGLPRRDLNIKCFDQQTICSEREPQSAESLTVEVLIPLPRPVMIRPIMKCSKLKALA